MMRRALTGSGPLSSLILVTQIESPANCESRIKTTAPRPYRKFIWHAAVALCRPDFLFPDPSFRLSRPTPAPNPRLSCYFEVDRLPSTQLAAVYIRDNQS